MRRTIGDLTGRLNRQLLEINFGPVQTNCRDAEETLYYLIETTTDENV